MNKRINKTIKRKAKHAVLRLRKLRAVWQRASLRKRLLVGGSAAGIILALTALIIVLSGSGKTETGARNVQNTAGQVIFAGVESGTEGVYDIAPTPRPTPSPTPYTPPTPTPTLDPTLRRGMEDPRVEVLQLRLIELGYLELDEPTQKFGSATEHAVLYFQRQVNFTKALMDQGITLDSDGIAGLKTQELLFSDSAPKYCVVYGMDGSDVSDMQEQLKDLGYMSSVTGSYLEQTVAALKSFQEENNLSVDGMCGAKTFELLYSDSAKESPNMRKAARTKANYEKMIAIAKDQVGDPYVRGSKGPSSFDCSGLVHYCLKEAGSNRRRLNAAGYANVSDWEKISSMGNLKKGDLIFFYSDDFSKIGHVGIVINNSGEMIDASSGNGKVVRRSYTTAYWKKHFYCGRRPW